MVKEMAENLVRFVFSSPESPVASIFAHFPNVSKINLRCRLMRGGRSKVPAVAVLAVVPGAMAAVEVEPKRASSAEVI